MNKNFFTVLILCVTIFCTAISCKNVFAEDISPISENISQPQITVDGKVVDLGDLGFFKYTLSQKVEDSLVTYDEIFASPFWSEFYKQIYKMAGLEIIDWDNKKQMLTLSTFMIPIREVAQKMGYKVEWNKENQKVTVSNDKREMFFYIGEDVYQANYEFMENNPRAESSRGGYAPLLFNDITFVPISIFDLLGYSYEINDNCINFTK